MILRLTVLLFTFSAIAIGQTGTRRFELGEQYTYFVQRHAYRPGDSMLGIRFDFNITKYFALDSQFDFGLRTLPPPAVSSINGGRLIVGRFGVKAGKRFRRFGVFGEIRPGFISASNALLLLDLQNGALRFGRLTERALNLGTAFEYRPVKHFGIRADVGDTLVFYARRQVVIPGPPGNGVNVNNVDVSMGFFYAF
ncbi:MAG: hypothetical protein WCC59_11535 [Terriglobales bacterium]